MKKLVKKLIRTLLVILAVVILSGLFIGHHVYREAIAEKPLQVAVHDETSKREYVPYNDLNKDFVDAVVAVEDKRFFERKGFDWIALGRAIYNNIFYTAREGGSTISQQVAKNLYFISKPRTIAHKIAEVYLMYDLENDYSKEDILALYANMNYYGDGLWGIDQASYGYFHHANKDCTLAQCAMLAGIPNAPAIYQLSTGYEKAKVRQEHVLDCMYRNEMITQQQYNQAKNENVLFNRE